MALLLSLGSGDAAAVELPAGGKLREVTAGVRQPSNLAFDRRGRLWITSAGHQTDPADGVWMLPRPGAKPVQVVAGLFSALGLLWQGDELFVSHVTPYATRAERHLGQVTAFSGFDGRRFARRRVVVDGLPTGLHRVDSLAADRAGRIYLGVGSQTDSEPATARLAASVVSFERGGEDLRVEAKGLRNPYGLALLPDERTLAVSEERRDDLGLRRPPEELNVLDPRGPPVDFGHPGCYGQGGTACAGTKRARVRLPEHSAAAGVAVAEGFGALGPSVFVALFGSSFDARPTGGEVVAGPAPRRQAGRAVRAVRSRFRPSGAARARDRARRRPLRESLDLRSRGGDQRADAAVGPRERAWSARGRRSGDQRHRSAAGPVRVTLAIASTSSSGDGFVR